jgi:hypothetical protein
MVQATAAFIVRGPIRRADLSGLSARVCALFARAAGDIRCDVGSVQPSVATVEALTRLQLLARRHGSRVVLVHASADLVELVAFLGLADVIPEDSVQPCRKPEQGEQRRGGEEKGELADPSIP